jgi:AbrB family looped-hinge helix DNA binding protein
MKSSNSIKNKPSILGLVTVNDKGQIVIPADARSIIELKAGDKLLVMIHPSHEGIMLIKPDGLESYAKQMLKHLNNVKQSVKESQLNG